MRLLIDWLRAAAKTRKRRSRLPGRLKVTFVWSFTHMSVTRKYVDWPQAERCTDEAFAGRPVSLKFPAALAANEFYARVKKIGVLAKREPRLQ
jgi:hypothetical protein